MGRIDTRRCRFDQFAGEPGLGLQAQAMSSKRLDKISDFARHGYLLQVHCRQCGHDAKLDTKRISAQAVERGWSRDLAAITSRLKCGKCGGRQVLCGPAFAS